MREACREFYSVANSSISQRNLSWWEKRTSLEGWLFAVLASVLLCVGFVMAFWFSSSIQPDTNKPLPDMYRTAQNVISKDHFPSHEDSECEESTVCLSPSCVREAAYLIDSMDETVDPCDNFYKFACGGFLSSMTIPDEKAFITSNTKLEEKLAHQIRLLLEEPSIQGEMKCFAEAKMYYNACMNKGKIEELGLKPMKELIFAIGGWPVEKGAKWRSENFKWQNSVALFRKLGLSDSYFMEFTITPNLKDSGIRVIDIDQPKLGLSREYLVQGLRDDPEIKAYHEYQVEMAVLFGANRTAAEKEMKDVLEFEIELANITVSSEERRNETKLFNPFTIAELEEKYPKIQWLKYINDILPKKVQVTKNETVVIVVPEFIEKLQNLLEKTNKRIQANYHIWRAVKSMAKFLSEDVLKLRKKYLRVFSGENFDEPRWKECVEIISDSGLTYALASVYVKTHFPAELKVHAMKMVNYLSDAFKEILRENSWMDEKTKERAIEKANAMGAYVGYTDEILNVTLLESLYAPVSLKKNTFFRSTLELNVIFDDFEYGNLRSPVNETRWIEIGTPVIVNAFYSLTSNSIEFPAGILQGINFDNTRPNYMNFGAIGWTIGHELTHGYDDEGRQFDGKGNIFDWWEKKTEEAFDSKAKCFINQYGDYKVDQVDLKLNGINTQGENIADNGGIVQAYRAYNNWVDENGIEKTLPGLVYNQNQLFWITAAISYCSKTRPESLKSDVLIGSHSPDEFRVIGTFSNRPEFSKDFNCEVGARMNPQHKCSLW